MVAEKKSKSSEKEDELLLQDFSRRVSTKSSALFYGNAFIVSAIPIWLYWRIHAVDPSSIAIILAVVTIASTWLVAFAYRNTKHVLKHKVAVKRESAVTKDMSKKVCFLKVHHSGRCRNSQTWITAAHFFVNADWSIIAIFLFSWTETRRSHAKKKTSAFCGRRTRSPSTRQPLSAFSTIMPSSWLSSSSAASMSSGASLQSSTMSEQWAWPPASLPSCPQARPNAFV